MLVNLCEAIVFNHGDSSASMAASCSHAGIDIS
jgi:hypothetical protein